MKKLLIISNKIKAIAFTSMLLFSSSSVVLGSDIYSPQKGSSERKAIMDSLRIRYNQPVVFQVHYLKVSDGWAWTRVTATVNGKPSFEPEAALVRKESGKWKVVGSVDQSGECAIEPKCLAAEYKELRKKFPDAPAGIFKDF